MTKMELRKRKGARDDVEEEGNKYSMAGLDAEPTSMSVSSGDRLAGEERFKRREDVQHCGHSVVYAHM